MSKAGKYIIRLLSLNLVITITGFFILTLVSTSLKFSELLILQAAFSIISAIAILIFLRGQTKAAESQTMHTLVSIGLKFLLELVLALAWFVIFKKNQASYVILFFVLYLCLTLFSVFYMLKTLKSKPL